MNSDGILETLAEQIEHSETVESFEALIGRELPLMYRYHAVWRRENKERYGAVLKTIRERVVGLVAGGHLIDNSYINLYFLYRGFELPEDETIGRLIPLFKQAYHEYSETQKEKFMFAHLLFVLYFLNGNDEEGLRFFLSEHLFFDGRSYSSMDPNAQALKGFLESHAIPFPVVAEAIVTGLEKETYVSRTFSQRHNLFVWILGFVWQINGYENHSEWKRKVYPALKELYEYYLCNPEAVETVMHLHFLMSHLFMNAAQTQEEFNRFNREIEIPGSEYYAKWGKLNRLEESKADSGKHKKKIALVKDRIVWNSPSKVEYSLLKALRENKHFSAENEIIIYSLALIEKSLDDQKLIGELKEMGYTVKEKAFQSLDTGMSYQSHLKRAMAVREDICSEGIGIMICATNNFPEVSFLFSTRTATRQIYWSHGNNAYDLLGIDQRITHFVPESPQHRFKPLFIPMDRQRFYLPERDARLIRETREQFPPDAFILGVVGRLVKVNSDDYLSVVARVMKEVPNTVFIAAGSGDIPGLRSKVESLGISDRFYTPGFVDPNVYDYIIDLWLDTFPLKGGEAVEEYRAKGGVCMVNTSNPDFKTEVMDAFENNPDIKSFVDRFGYADSLWEEDGEFLGLARYADSLDEYVRKTVRMILDKPLREKYSILATQQMEYEYQIAKERCVREFQNLVDQEHS